MPAYEPRAYPAAEIAIALSSRAPEHVQEGDILALREPYIGIGLKEAELYLWLLIEGPEVLEYAQLTDPLHEPLDPTRLYEGPTYTHYDKRRFCVPLARLQAVFPTLDLVRARDPLDTYQPFFTIDGDDNLWLTDRSPLQVEGLIFDKATGVYL